MLASWQDYAATYYAQNYTGIKIGTGLLTNDVDLLRQSDLWL